MLPPPVAEIDVEAEYDRLAAMVREHLDLDLIRRVMGLEDGAPAARGS